MRHQRGRVDAPVLLAITVAVTLFTVLPMLVSVTAGLTHNFSRGMASGFTTRWLMVYFTSLPPIGGNQYRSGIVETYINQ